MGAWTGNSDPLFDGDAGGEGGEVEGDLVVGELARDFDAGLLRYFDEVEKFVCGGVAEGGGVLAVPCPSSGKIWGGDERFHAE